MNVNQIVVGECAKVMQQLPAGSVDLIVTSPPYDDLRDYNGYEFDYRAVGEGMLHVLKPGGVAVWIVGDRVRNGSRSLTSFEQGLAFRDIGFRVHDVMIYRKKNTPFMRKNAYTNCFELMFILSRGAPKTFNPLTCDTKRSGRETAMYGKGTDGDGSKRRAMTLGKRKTRTNIWSYAVGLGGTTRDKFAFQHPAMFPEALAQDHILSWSNPGDLVLDPMCGAGTTLKMAQANGRRWLGIEISDEYADIAKQRVGQCL